ncbi:MAG: hypothetical protein RLY71_1869 [Pseudomonadota bacterium]|jgi:hypothetical protein
MIRNQLATLLLAAATCGVAAQAPASAADPAAADHVALRQLKTDV